MRLSRLLSLGISVAHGRPLVTTHPIDKLRAAPSHQAGDGPRLVDGENCLLSPPKNVAALTAALERLLASPELRQHLGQGARKLAEGFTWEAIAAKTRELYQEVLGATG